MTSQAKRRILGLLRIEIENLHQRGFGGLLCLGTSGRSPSDCCEACPLLDLTPPERRKAESPCRHIPLNPRGETVETILAGKQGRAYLEEQLLAWMEQTAGRLQRELQQESPSPH